MATAGDNHLGGQDFVDNMMKHCIQEITGKFGMEVAEDEATLRELRVECEQAKCLLSSSPEETLVIKTKPTTEQIIKPPSAAAI